MVGRWPALQRRSTICRARRTTCCFRWPSTTPLLPHDFLARALPQLETAPAVIAAYGAQDYPTNAVWRLEAIGGLAAAVRAGTAPRSLKRFAEDLGAARLDYAPLADSDPFRNANTPDDLAFLRRAAGHGDERLNCPWQSKSNPLHGRLPYGP